MPFDKLKEECAVFGASLRKDAHNDSAAGIAYNGLLSLQHRGQESAGLAGAHNGALLYHKGPGLVGDVLSRCLDKFDACPSVIGHCRYSMRGSNSDDNIQPFVTEYLTGRVAAAHNGNIINAADIKKELQTDGLHFSAESDAEVISALIAYYCRNSRDVVEAVVRTAQRLNGAFSMLVLSGNGLLVAVRDPNGFRPLCVGKNANGIAFASESCALESCGFTFLRDVQPGEILVAENGQIIYEAVRLPKRDHAYGLCLFELVYFARPDSVIDGMSVYEARCNMGRILAQEHPVEADVVCGVPDSGIEAAIGYSAQSGIPLVLGFVKNRYMGRSFIYPSQMQRESAVRLKLNPLTAAIGGKRVVLVDDSIVRGTTGGQIVRALKEAGAREVHMRISSPPFKYTCHFGTDVGDENNLVANQLTLDEIAGGMEADSLGYISLEGLKNACSACRLSFCECCFAGNGHNH
jgi:amidophosphoribosyltransferase